MNHLLRLFAVAAMPSTLLAQYDVSPPQAVNVEGRSSSGLLFSYPKSRQQQVDSNLIGSRFVLLRGISFRQSNSHTRTKALARTIEMRIDLGFGVANPTTTYDKNYKTGTRATVFPKQIVKLPDWRGATPTPAPFSLKFPFKNLFFYKNTESLVWDMLVTKNSVAKAAYYVDWLPTAPAVTRGTTPKALGIGCKTGTGTFTHKTNFDASSTNIRLGWGVTGAPASSIVVPAFGLSDPNASIGWCTNLRTNALLLAPATRANANGTTGGTLIGPWVISAAGVTLYTQVAAADRTRTGLIALSNGVAGSIPFAKGGGGGAALKVHGLYNFTTVGATGTRYINAIPVRYDAL
jgi:hypothetical protein